MDVGGDPMLVDNATDARRRPSSPNAVAGPSSVAGPPPLVFLPPPIPSFLRSVVRSPSPLTCSPHPAPSAPSGRLASTQDLLARFHLLPAYEKHVRPFYAAPPSASDHPLTPSAKGKERERDSVPSPAFANTLGVDGMDVDDDEGGAKGEKKKKNTYKHLIRGVPGKHSMKKDQYLTTIMQVPPKQRISITQFDTRTQQEAFTVSPEGLKGWNINLLVQESAQAREDRKKRKELKKLAKAQAMGLAAQSPAPAAPSAPLATPSNPRPPSIPPSATAPVRTATPKPRPPATAPATQGRGATPLATPTPLPPQVRPHPLAGGAPPDPARRGVKRDLEDSPAPPAAGIGTGQDADVPRAILAAKAGVAGARPRPVKKQRMDSQGQAREMPIQQPTPQGV